jgi:hypothetical protein
MMAGMTTIPQLVRTPDELRAARQILGLSAEGLATMVRMGDGRTVRRWESGENEIPGPVTVVLETAMDFLRQRDDISRQIEMMQSGEMRAGTMSWGGIREDTTAESIVRLVEARNSLEQALAILTRQPPGDGSPANRVHWYDLRRISPRYRPGEKDSWSLPGETSSEAALAYFVRDAGFPSPLEICGGDDLAAEFVLEKRSVLRTQSGASQHLRAGDAVVEGFFVKLAAQGRYVIEIMQRGVAEPIRAKGVDCDDLEKLKGLAHELFNEALRNRGIVGVHSVRVRDSGGRVIYRKAAADA